MNIGCQNSFDANLKIRISTPNGQKDLEAKSRGREGTHVPTPKFTQASAPDTVNDKGGCWVAHPAQDLQSSLGRPNSTFRPEPSSFQAIPTSWVTCCEASNFADCVPAGPWNIDIPPFNNPSQHNAVDDFGAQGSSPVITFPMHCGMPSLASPSGQHPERPFTWGTASSPGAQDMEGLGIAWWSLAPQLPPAKKS
ncbi:hypothetical protein VTI74DRAFT_2158 [Chaetomium olivicolor]